MEHDRLIDALSALHDGELGADERREVLGHLEGCTDCRTSHERWQRISGALFKRAPAPSAADSERFARVVMARLRQEEPAVSGWQAWLSGRWLIPALSVGIVAASLAIVFSPGSDNSMPGDDTLLLSQASGLAQWIIPNQTRPSGPAGLLLGEDR